MHLHLVAVVEYLRFGGMHIWWQLWDTVTFGSGGIHLVAVVE